MAKQNAIDNKAYAITVDTTAYATTFDTNVVAAAVTLSGTTLQAYGTPAAVSMTISPKGAGTVNVTNLALGLTAHGILVSENTGATVAMAAGTAGQIVISGGAADPSWTTTTYPADSALGDILYGSAAHVISRLSANATATRYLANTGVNNIPNWDQVNLSNGVTNTLPVGNGGTGQTSLTAHGILLGEGTSAIGITTAGTSGQIITSGGSSADPAWTTSTYPSSTNAGALLVATAANVVGQLGSTGTAGTILTSGGALTVPAWSTTTYADTIAKGALVVATAANAIGSLGSTGTSGQHLTSAGAATVPAWSTSTYADTIGAGAIVVATAANTIGSLGSTGSAGQLLVSQGTTTVPAWTTAVYPTDSAAGDIIYGSATHTYGRLSFVNAATLYLANTGSSSTLPAWAQINLANGVTNTLPVGNGGTGQSSALTSSGIVYASSTTTMATTAAGTGTSGTNGKVLMGVSSGAPVFSTALYPSTCATGDIVSGTATNTLGVIAGSTALSNYVLLGNGANVAPTWQQMPGFIKAWVTVSSSTAVTIAGDTGYVVTLNGSTAQFTLPTTSTVGHIVKVLATAAGTSSYFKISCPSGTSILFGTLGTSGSGGYIISATLYNTIELVCIIANTTWQVTSAVGTFAVN